MAGLKQSSVFVCRLRISSIPMTKREYDAESALAALPADKLGSAERQTGPTLNAGQQHLFALATVAHASMYFGGDAGTGKTHVTQAIIDALRDAGRVVVVCAPTGQAAQHLDGMTIHSLFGLRPVAGASNGQCTHLHKWSLRSDLEAAETIVIDELSMVSEQLFNDMNRRLRFLRDGSRPMGGVQIIALGDFAQLPPVGDRATAAGRFCFHARDFHSLFGTNMFQLTQQMRQADDVRFAQLLSRIRVANGTLSADDKTLLNSRRYTPGPVPFDMPYLFSRTNDVVSHNAVCAARLGPEVPAYVWKAIDWTANDEAAAALRTMRMDEEVDLRVGAPVLLRFNLDQRRRLVNGTRGIVRAIVPPCELGLRSCGQCEVCKGDAPRPEHKFEDFLGALPRDARVPVPLVEMDINGTPVVYAFGLHCQEKMKPARGRGGALGALAPGSLLCSRTQLPLTLAWAFTMHKAQGMTMPQVCVSMNRLFEAGQLYVALSRARRLEDVHIIGDYIPVARIVSAPDAVAFERRYMRPLH